MEYYINFVLKVIFVENFVLIFFLGMCLFFVVFKCVEIVVGFGIVVIFVLMIMVLVNNIVLNYLFEEGVFIWFSLSLVEFDFFFLVLFCFIGLIVVMVQLVEMMMEWFFFVLYGMFGIFLLLIVVNCVIFGGFFFMQECDYMFVESIVYGFGVGIGWFFVIVVLVFICESMCYSNVLMGLWGFGMIFIFIGFIGIGFMVFGGIQF